MNVYEKIQKVRVDLQNTKLNKSGKNGYAGYEYFQLKDFIPELNNLLLQEKLFTNFSINGEVATLEIINAEKVDEKVVFSSPIADANLKGCTPVQCLGGVHTYVKRYLYQNAFEIVEDDAIEKETGNPNKQPETQPKVFKPKAQEQVQEQPKAFKPNDILKYPQSKEQLEKLSIMNIPKEWLLKVYGFDNISFLDGNNSQALIDAYDKKHNK